MWHLINLRKCKNAPWPSWFSYWSGQITIIHQPDPKLYGPWAAGAVTTQLLCFFIHGSPSEELWPCVQLVLPRNIEINTNFSIKIVLEYLTWSYDDSSKTFRSEARQIQIRDKNRWFSIETKTFYWFKPWSNKSWEHHWKRNSSISLSLSLAELSGSVLCLYFLGSSDSGE